MTTGKKTAPKPKAGDHLRHFFSNDGCEVEVRTYVNGLGEEELDEVVVSVRVGKKRLFAFHLEQMNHNQWWMDAAGVHVWLTTDRRKINARWFNDRAQKLPRPRKKR